MSLSPKATYHDQLHHSYCSSAPWIAPDLLVSASCNVWCVLGEITTNFGFWLRQTQSVFGKLSNLYNLTSKTAIAVLDASILAIAVLDASISAIAVLDAEIVIRSEKTV